MVAQPLLGFAQGEPGLFYLQGDGEFHLAPLSLKLGIAAGIGFFLGLIGMKSMGLVVAHPATLVGLGRLSDPAVLLGVAGFILIAGLSARRVPGAIVIGILATAAAGLPLGLTKLGGVVALPPSLAPTFLQLDIAGALGLGIAGIVFTFFLVGTDHIDVCPVRP